MKKLLLLMLILVAIQNVSAQILQSENFDSLPIGAVGTDATGTIPTNNYYTLSTNYDLDPLATTTGTNASAENFQIIDYGAGHGTVLQIEGTNGDKGRRNMWQGGLADQWSFRDAGNDIIEVEFDLFTGTAGGDSNNTKGLYIYDSTTTSTALKILGGYVFNTKTLVLTGIAYFTSATSPVGNYGFFLGATAGTNLVLEPNVWVRLYVEFDKSSGKVVWKGPGFLGQTTGAAVNLDPDKIAFVSRSGSVAATATTPAIVNAAATTNGLFDNLIARATNVSLLGVEEIASNEISYSVYPNPANNLITVSSKESSSINAITISDINGRTIKSQTFDGNATIEMNVSDLSKGMYLMKIASENGTSIQKIMKN
jgi:Secretion system C-terminal sorting domain